MTDRPDLDSDADALVAGAYHAVLGRMPEPEGLRSAAEALRSGTVGRFEFVRNLTASPEFSELVTMEALTRAARATGRPFDPDAPVGNAAASERVAEVPWVLSRYRGERRVLDVGYANAPAAYLTLLLGLCIPELHCVDLAARRLRGASASRADVRRLPYADETFELVLCVSTLEHIGLDNTRYVPLREVVPGDSEALVELARVLTPEGRLLVTVPVGRKEHHQWFHQYDMAGWGELLGRSPFETEEQAAFWLGPKGWERQPDLDALGALRYGTAGPGAQAVLCTSLVHRAR